MKMSLWGKKYLSGRNSVILLLFFVAGYIGWRSPNRYTGTTPVWDSGVFLTVAYNMHQGKVLYKDIYDNKPPLFFTLMYLAAHNQEDLGVNGVRYLEKINAAIMCCLLFVIALSFLGSVSASFLGALLFALVHYHPEIIHNGNMSEEFGNCFFFLAILFCCPHVMKRYPRASLLLIGLFSCAAGLIKEPYVIICLPWLCYGIMQARRYRIGVVRGFSLVALGVVLAVSPFVLYFASHDALSDWVEMYAKQFTYIEMRSNFRFDYFGYMQGVISRTWLSELFLLSALLTLANRPFLRRSKYFPVVAVISYGASLVASMAISGRILPNYIVMQVSSWGILMTVGVAHIISGVTCVKNAVIREAKKRSNIKPIVYASLGMLLCIVVALEIYFLSVTFVIIRLENDARFFRQAIARLSQPMQRWGRHKTTLEAILPKEVVQRDGVLIMHQRIALYGPMHGFTTPEQTKPYFGISQGIDAMFPNYISACKEYLLKEPPAVFIGNQMYASVIHRLEPALEENYVFLGSLPLYVDGDTSHDPEFAKEGQLWYVRKDLMEQVDMEVVQSLRPE